MSDQPGSDMRTSLHFAGSAAQAVPDARSVAIVSVVAMHRFIIGYPFGLSRSRRLD
jgi:hypothetical protein